MQRGDWRHVETSAETARRAENLFQDLAADPMPFVSTARVRARLFRRKRWVFHRWFLIAAIATTVGVALAAQSRSERRQPVVGIEEVVPNPIDPVRPVHEEKVVDEKPRKGKRGESTPLDKVTSKRSRRAKKKKSIARKAAPPNDEARLNHDEIVLFRRALRARPTEALRLLDVYSRRFPHGSFVSEATIVRIKALLALGRQAEARAILKTLVLEAGFPRALELRLIRGELSLAAGQCEEARRDLKVVLETADAPSWIERASRPCRERNP